MLFVCSDSLSGGTTEETISTTDPDSGVFVKGERDRQLEESRLIRMVGSSPRQIIKGGICLPL